MPEPSSAELGHSSPAHDRSLHVDTALVHLGRPPVHPGVPVNFPPETVSTYYAGGEPEYARDGTVAMAGLEESLAWAEGAAGAVVFSSGMAAASAILDGLPIGAVVVAAEFTYTGVSLRLRELDAAGRIELRRVDIADTGQTITALPGATLVWIESPTNPMLEVADIAAIATAAHDAGAAVVCDNTFATPLGQQPLSLGADIVMHSATKFIGGHSDCMLGAVLVADRSRLDDLRLRRILLGALPGSLETFLVQRGLRTLSLRQARCQANAQIIARRLAEHPQVSRVRYPGLPDDPGYEVALRQMSGPGALIAIEVAGGAAAAQAMCERTRLWIHATSLGGVESLLERRRRWEHENPNVPEGLVRLSVGIEDPEDLWHDLDAALRG